MDESARTGEDEPSLSALLMRTARTLRRGHLSALEPFGLRPHQSRALGVIARHGADGDLRLADLADHLGIARRSATEVVDALEQQGLVARTPSPTDRRAIVLRLTTEGQSLRRRIERSRAELGDQFFASLSEAERDQLAGLLRKALDDHCGP